MTATVAFLLSLVLNYGIIRLISMNLLKGEMIDYHHYRRMIYTYLTLTSVFLVYIMFFSGDIKLYITFIFISACVLMVTLFHKLNMFILPTKNIKVEIISQVIIITITTVFLIKNNEYFYNMFFSHL